MPTPQFERHTFARISDPRSTSNHHSTSNNNGAAPAISSTRTNESPRRSKYDQTIDNDNPTFLLLLTASKSHLTLRDTLRRPAVLSYKSPPTTCLPHSSGIILMHFAFILTVLVTLVPIFALPTPDDSKIGPRATLELFPNLIINVDSTNPGAPSGAGYIATMSPQLVALFSFDIPYDISPTCTLNFQLPPQGPIFYDTVVGSGSMDVMSIHGVFGTPTSYGAVSSLFGASYGSLQASIGGASSGIGVPCSAGSKFQVVYFPKP